MTEITEVPSPFCGIGTDDLVVSVDGLSLQVTQNGCAVNTPAFEQPVTDTRPRVQGREVSLEVAAAKAAELLRNTKLPVIGGCAADVNGMRALLSLADKCGAVVDNVNFTAARRNFLTLQDSGWINTTLAEVKNRCDVLLIVGSDPERFAPRFFERYIWNEEAMFLHDTAKREIIYLGKAPSGDASTAPDGRKPLVFECSDHELPDAVSVLRALIKGRPIHAESAAGIAITDLQSIAEILKAAKYGVVTWAAGELAFDHAELTIQMLCETIKDINNLDTRCSGLPLGGKEGDQTANQVCGWTTGFPARTRFSAGYPEYDPYLNDIAAMTASGEADALVWVHAFNTRSVPPETGLPTIVVGRSGMTFEREPEVFIPVGTPGIDHAGHAYRMDNVVAIRLKKLRESGLPSVMQVLSAIEQAL
ncbi:MAG: formylmethanofuran dehydrogenase subunit B [Gammaproteobacteria bacterium]